MPSARKPGPDCGHSGGSHGHRATGASAPASHHSREQNAADVRLVSVEVAPQTLQKKLTFDRPLEVTDVSKFLFGDANHSAIIKPVDGSGRHAFILATHDVATVMSLPPAVRNAIILGGIVTSTGKPWDFPGWLPKNIQDDIVSGKLDKGVTHYKGTGDWGDIVVWKGNASVQFYQEFPDSLQYYQRITSNTRTARLVHFAYTEWNRDLRYLVDDKGMSPEDARDELRRINEEIFKLIIEGVAKWTLAASYSMIGSGIRASADQVAAATRRSARFVESEEAEAVEAEEAEEASASTNLPQSPALKRLQGDQRNLLNTKVERSSSVLQKPTRFRHSLFKSDNPPATYIQIRRSGKLVMSTGGGAHYGEGVYVYGTEVENLPNMIEVEVPSGVAVEELRPEGQGVFYRLVPASGNGVPVVIKDTNIPEETIKLMEKLFGTE
jgi:hypothetical protein